MQTVLTRSPAAAARFILNGEIVAFPTETVYGLGANIFDEQCLRKIFVAKKRPPDNPFIVHIADFAGIDLLARRVPPAAEKLIEHFFPGPLTVVLPKRDSVPLIATAGLPTVGIRMPHHPVAQALLKVCRVPLAAPSANLAGRPSPTTWQSVLSDLNGRIACILKGGRTRVGLESTVLDCTGRVPVVLRSGAVTLEQLQEVVPATRLGTTDAKGRSKSPGMKYRHYSPRARVVVVSRPDEGSPGRRAAFIGRQSPPGAGNYLLKRVCKDSKEYAHELFDFFRRCDETNVSVIFCQSVDPKGIGLALMDRLKRASQ